jgi:ribonuclease HI
MTVKKLVIYTDGASRGNPGPAAIGVVIKDESGRVADSISLCLGRATNNQAEYRAIIAGMEKALLLGASHIDLRSDSELVVRQLSGEYKVKNADLKPLFQQVERLRLRLNGFTVSYIPREDNHEADKLANEALDGHKASEPQITSDIRIRPALKSDYPALIPIIREIEKQHVKGVPEFFRIMPQDEQERELDTILTQENAALLVAEREGELMGYINIALKEAEVAPMLYPRRYVRVRDLAVGEKYQHSGAGNALMQAAESWAKAHGVDMLDLNVWEFNKGAFAFYDKLGYRTANRHMWKSI